MPASQHGPPWHTLCVASFPDYLYARRSDLLQISVNASIVKDSGGTCVCPTGDGCFTDPDYAVCVAEVQRDLITTTAAVSALASVLLGALANLPVGMAPGLGLNAYVSTYL